MVYETVIKFVLLLNAVMLTKLQVIHDSRCNNVKDDMWMKIKELQLDVLSYRKESLQLQSRLVKVETEFAAYRNESQAKLVELQDELNGIKKSVKPTGKPNIANIKRQRIVE